MIEDKQIRFVGSAIVPYEGGFLYVQTKKDGKIGLPGGKPRLFEDILVAVSREVKEEVNIEITLETGITIHENESTRGNHIINFIYLGKIVRGTPKIVNPKEIEAIRILSLGQVRKEYERGNVRSLSNVVALEEYLSGKRFTLDTVKCFFER